MQSVSSVASAESGTITVKGFKPTIISQHDEKAPGSAELPAAVVVADTTEDRFKVQIGKDDPSHPMVGVSRLFLRLADVSERSVFRTFQFGRNGT